MKPVKKFFNSVAVRLSLRFTIVVATIMLLLSVGFVIAVGTGARGEKRQELRECAHLLYKALMQGDRRKFVIPDSVADDAFDYDIYSSDRKFNYSEFYPETIVSETSVSETSVSQASDANSKNLENDSLAEETENQTDSENSEFNDYRLPRYLPRLPYYVTYLIYDADDRTVLYTNDPLLPFLPLSEKPKSFVEKNYFIDGDLNILYCSREFEIPYGNIVVQISENMENDSSQDYWNQVLKILLMSVGPVLFLSFFICWTMIQHTMSPVVHMTESAKKISSSNLEQKLPVSKHDDELDKLASTFNELFMRLKTDFDRERQFTSDVSHELKTPVAVILGQSNLLRRWGKNDPAQLDKSLSTIINESKSMQAIIENLLQMSRLESGRVTPEFSSISIVNLFNRLKDELLSVSPECSVVIEAEGTSENVLADKELLHQVFTVIVSNSLKFTKAATSKVEIIFRSTEYCKFGKKYAVMEVEDNGKGFGDGKDHVFERFYREDTAHSRSAGGSGLGLSIAKTITECMNGKISVYNSAKGGAVVRVELPISED